jgi:GNAT superfamily N-acetyltransferase
MPNCVNARSDPHLPDARPRYAPAVRIRSAVSGDLEFLRAMGYEAAMWRPGGPRPPLDEVLAQPHFARYLSAWGRSGDAAVIAEDERGAPFGAAWYRVFTASEPGFGFVDDTTPELSIAVREDARGRGIGASLLHALAHQARRDGFNALSLSVEKDNPAVRLYRRAGFRVVDGDANAFTMCLRLQAQG